VATDDDQVLSDASDGPKQNCLYCEGDGYRGSYPAWWYRLPQNEGMVTTIFPCSCEECE
jgi:hypothetical protein